MKAAQVSSNIESDEACGRKRSCPAPEQYRQDDRTNDVDGDGEWYIIHYGIVHHGCSQRQDLDLHSVLSTVFAACSHCMK